MLEKYEKCEGEKMELTYSHLQFRAVYRLFWPDIEESVTTPSVLVYNSFFLKDSPQGIW